MLIPPAKIQASLRCSTKQGGDLRLQSSHLIIPQELAVLIFQDEPNVNVIFYPSRNTLMLAPASDDLFKNLHKAKQHMLKNRKSDGEKCVALHEILLDNEIDNLDRDLNYKVQSELKILSVNF